MAGARAHFVHAGKIGARFAHRDLITSARIGEGRMLIYLGDIAEGLALLDEAMVAIEAGELSPLASGDAYCSVIDACSELFDLGRCRAWTESFVRWCDTQQELVLYRGHCFLHRAEVLGLLGAWPEALVEARHACDRLAAPVNPAALAGACAIEGDLLRLVSDFDGAEAAYQRASEHGRDPQPGLALLRLAQGRPTAADAMIRRALDEAQDPISRARLLAPYVEIVLSTGDTTAARAAAEELREVAATLGTPLLRAHAARAAGAVLGAEGEPKAALVELRSAFNEFHALGVRYDAARTRLLIAEACAAVGDHDAAAMESGAARVVLDSLATAETSNATVEPGTTSSFDGSHPTRAGDPSAPRPRQDQPGNRARARHQRKDGGEPRQPHLHQTRRHVAKRRHRLRLRPRPRRIVRASTSSGAARRRATAPHVGGRWPVAAAVIGDHRRVERGDATVANTTKRCARSTDMPVTRTVQPHRTDRCWLVGIAMVVPPTGNPSCVLHLWPGQAELALRGLRFVLVERVLGDVGDAVDHHVADLALADEADQSPGRDAQAPGCFGCGEEVSRHRRLRTGQPSRVYG